MCLNRVYKQGSVERLPDKIVAYKVVKRRGGCYYPPFFAGVFKKGLNVSPKIDAIEAFSWKTGLSGEYNPYYHCWATLATARQWRHYTQRIIKVHINKKDVECVGSQDGRVIVTRKFTIKSFREVK